MNTLGSITDIIRNKCRRKTEVNKSGTVLYRHSGLYYVTTMLIRFCDGLRHIYYDLRLVWDGLRRFLTILTISEINSEVRYFLLACYKTVLNRKESSIETCKSLNFISKQIKIKKTILQRQNGSIQKYPITAWKVKAKNNRLKAWGF